MNVPSSDSSVLIVGCGDIGLRVARLESSDGATVYGLARSVDKADCLESEGVVPVMGDLDDPASLQGLNAADCLLYYFAPPPPVGETDTRIAALLEVLKSPNVPRRVVLISTSGVYGDCGGEWVDEDRPPKPRTDRARRRLDAENRLRIWAKEQGVVIVILRVPGIYGPGRLPVDRLRRTVPVVRPEEAPISNRIHADDLARICRAAGRVEPVSGVYNVSDGDPTSMTDYFYRVADHLALPRPRAISMEQARRELSPGILSFLEESRRIDNRRMLRELKVALRFPDLNSGLDGC